MLEATLSRPPLGTSRLDPGPSPGSADPGSVTWTYFPIRPHQHRPGRLYLGFALCSLDMAGRNPGHFGESLSPRGKWVLGVIGVVLVAVLAGVGVWSAVGKSS